MDKPQILLASQSPFRKEQLTQLGFSFKSLAPNVDEKSLQKSYSGKIEDLSDYLAEKKASSIAKSYPQDLVIGSDQVLLFREKLSLSPAR